MSTAGSRGSRRGALVSVPRGARSLAVDVKRNAILVGTCIASGGNELHTLTHSVGADALAPEAVYECDEEVWGICAVGEEAGTCVTAVALRERGTSSLQLWRLSESGDALVSGLSPERPEIPKHKPERLCSTTIDSGKAKYVRQYSGDNIILSSSTAATIYRVDSTRSDVESIAVISSPSRSSRDSAVVCSDFCPSTSTILIATRGSLTLHDPRCSPSDVTYLFSDRDMRPSAAEEVSASGQRPEGRGLSLRPRQLHISAAAAGPGNIVAAGGEDGDVYAVDVRAAGKDGGSLVWHAPDVVAHAHWVTSLAVGPGESVASGSSDGVVRVWSGGQPVGTYPIHDETVYGSAWLAGDSGFASLSYDGRLAINPRPVGST